VVKVFVNTDATIELEPYHDLLHRVHSHLDNAAPNCLMYATVRVSYLVSASLKYNIEGS